MSITNEEMDHLSDLAMLKLSAEDKDLFTKQLNTILEYFDELQEVDTSDIEATSHVLPIRNVFREDKVEESIPLCECLQNAPQIKNGFFVVPKIIDTE
ncbi:MAG: Asp-tRNA(Asn)/Glu-tRNA(Gln) amidotransferase subunit GatC [Candidatus Scalindua sp.]|jgi:aspartyl-tRNA(Asn)/glutamyl-tRNA(Gln) amidotransferase subunit C|nr:Asp-tRNA(Asn)/Glu-tRNA(Gln) amidotransferase subunit GatC [Candidatus Scalindua sp.]MDV5166513.1 Asp-tRNA(Asn)/Glu-tRNA(Gln) amidotransferase subunit GatC [Candidatus Scalindua sp.]